VGVQSAGLNIEAAIQTEVCWWDLSSAEMGRGIQCRMK